MSHTAIPKGFAILPIILPDDIPQLLRLHYQVYLSGNTMQAHPSDGPISEAEFIAQHSPYMYSKFSEANAVLWKLVPPADADADAHTCNPCQKPEIAQQTQQEDVEGKEADVDLIAYIGLRSPREVDGRSVAERQRELRQEVETMPCESDEHRERSYELMWKGKILNDAFLGEKHEARYWLLDALYVDQRWQRRGLGTGLVRWGVDFASGESGRRRRSKADLNEEESDYEAGKGEDNTERKNNANGEDVEVEGMWLLSSSAGEKTYRNCGFEKVGEESITQPVGRNVTFYWYVKKF